MKRITFCALLMTLFLLMSCNNSASSPKDGQAAKSDGTLIDLKSVSSKITEAVAFAKSVKDVHTLVKSIDELAKAIGKKVDNAGKLADDADKDKNGSLVAGVYSVVLDIQTKLVALETKINDNELKKQVTEAKTSSTEFINKVKGANATLGKNDAKADDAKKAIDRTSQPNGDKGAEELGKLNTAVDALLKAADAAVESAIKELTTSVKPSNI
ncbi:Vsp/OspC family lipoprotein [Borrelia parkeri]